MAGDYMLAGGPFVVRTAVGLFMQLCDALSYCHTRGVCHRDVKPINLFISSNYRLLLGDFGLAGLNNDHTYKTYCGTMSYMAPEVIKGGGKKYDGVKADCWSAGICFFNLLTFSPPFNSATAGDWYYDKISSFQWEVYFKAIRRTFPTFPKGAEMIVSSILVMEPKDRPTVASLLENQWLQRVKGSEEEVAEDLRNRETEWKNKRSQERLQAAAKKKAGVGKRGRNGDPFAVKHVQRAGGDGEEGGETGNYSELSSDYSCLPPEWLGGPEEPICFYSHETPTYVKNRILDHIYHFKGMIKKQEPWEITSVFMMDDSHFTVEIKFRIFTCGEVLLVHLKRRAGDLLSYYKFSKELMSLMADIMPERVVSQISSSTGEEMEYHLDADDIFILPPRLKSGHIREGDPLGEESSLISSGPISMI